jgi:general secretion pathway protein G
MKIGFQFIIIVAVLMIMTFGAAACGLYCPSKTTIAKIQIEEFKGALQAFELDIGRFPTSTEGLDALVDNPGNLKGWNGPYLAKDLPTDPWSRAYVYRCPGEHGDYDLFSYGRDGVEGGKGVDADIVSWETPAY